MFKKKEKQANLFASLLAFIFLGFIIYTKMTTGELNLVYIIALIIFAELFI